MLQPHDRVLYQPPTLAGRTRAGTVIVTSGQSALVLYDGDRWPIWAPVARLLPIHEQASGWAQILLVPAVSP